ncbi:hypothetical protein BKA65DRAFT_569354 [Rhexocercosporidium sp. MPI-PUGE-AT-0058]|nr:hypothetical protein BKA65DRAFT_569354 [Rhexocercosporidium sp. MPI-PUGE-AT-0058]
MACILLASLLLSLTFKGVFATDPLGMCTKSTPRTCFSNDIEQLFISNGPITTLNCNFTLSTTLDGTTMPYAINAFNPKNELYPVPFSSFSPTNQNPVVKFSLRDRKIETTLAPYPDLGLEGEKYREVLVTNKNPDQYGSSNAFLLNGVGVSGLLVEVEGRMKWQCIDGTVSLVLVAPEGKNFITDAEAFQRVYPAPLLIDNAYLGRFFSSGDVFKKVDVVVQILYDE